MTESRLGRAADLQAARAVLDSVPIDELRLMRDHAWMAAVQAWSEYHAAVRRAETLHLTNILCDRGWESELYWRHLYDAVRRRETAP